MPIKNFDATLKDFDGSEIQDPNNDGKITPLTYYVKRALCTPFADEPGLPGDVKVERYATAMKVHKGGDVELTPEEVVEIKKCVGKCFAPVIVGQIYEILNAN